MSDKFPKTRWSWGIALVFFCLLAALPAFSQEDEVRQVVARVAFFFGDVSMCRGDSPDDWQPVALNVPLTQGDRVYSGRAAKLELQMPGWSLIFLGDKTDLSPLQLSEAKKQFSLSAGTATFHLQRFTQDDYFEIATPNVSVTLESAGDYRLDVDDAGNTVVAVHRGQARLSAGGQEMDLSEGTRVRISGGDAPEVDDQQSVEFDGWDRWVQGRLDRYRDLPSYRYVHPDVEGLDDLDAYGRWEEVADYGWLWTPRDIEYGWQPYRTGRWIWQDPWGWTWLAEEPWGWAPYHYGRWAYARDRWYWVPHGRSERYARYSPALVAFVGGGPGWSASLTVGGGYVGWFPLGPRDPFYHWWGHGRHAEYMDRVVYANQRYITIVNHQTFVGGGYVGHNFIRDGALIRQVSAAQVFRGPIPVLPGAGALHFSQVAGGHAIIRPSAMLLSRSVVTRFAPPPPPPSFTDKLVLIRRNQGTPFAAASLVQGTAGGLGTSGKLGVGPVTRLATSSGKPLVLTASSASRLHLRPMTLDAKNTGMAAGGTQGQTQTLSTTTKNTTTVNNANVHNLGGTNFTKTTTANTIGGSQNKTTTLSTTTKNTSTANNANVHNLGGSTLNKTTTANTTSGSNQNKTTALSTTTKNTTTVNNANVHNLGGTNFNKTTTANTIGGSQNKTTALSTTNKNTSTITNANVQKVGGSQIGGTTTKLVKTNTTIIKKTPQTDEEKKKKK